MRMREIVSHHRLLAGVVAAGLFAAVVGVAVWFQPQQLFIDRTVSEGLPAATPMNRASAAEMTAVPEPSPAVVRSGPFRSIDHATSGRAALVRLPDGSHIVRFEGLQTDNGPDLRVWLSAAAASADGREYASRFVDLGALKGNRGDQNYVVPSGTDVSQFRSVVIWCRRFTVAFGSAPLEG